MIADDLAVLVRVPSLTGDELAAFEALAAMAERLGLRAQIHSYDLEALRAHPDHPGEEVARTALHGLEVTRPGTSGRRLALNGHVDVVATGSEPWRHGDPFSGAIEDGWLYGRGAVDMKAGVIAALHAMAAAEGSAEIVLHAVASEEDGGLGTFAALERDAAFDAAIVTEPTGFDVVCAQAGALTFRATVPGRAAHAAYRLEGRSALDRYVALHTRLAQHERAVNADVSHPLMRELELPYPLVVGRIAGGEWSSSVPDRVVVEGRLGVPVGSSPQEAMAAFEAVVADGEQPAIAVEWPGGRFHPGQTAPDHPFVAQVAAAVEDERGAPARVAGVPWGADLRLYCARGIPAAMVGTHGIERAHAVDERVAIADVESLVRILVRVIDAF